MKSDDRRTSPGTGSSAALTGEAFAGGSANDDRTDEAMAALHIMYSLTRDPRLRDELLAHYDSLAVRLGRGFPTLRGDVEDRVQVARVGLIHALDRFDPSRERPFVAFARMTIIGELKRHVRDHTWRLRTPRSLQEHYLVMVRTADDLRQELGRSPRIAEIAARSGLTHEQVLETMEVAASVRSLSLDQPVGGPDGPSLDPGDHEPGYDLVENRRLLATIITRLSEREQEIIRLRFYDELTQNQIATRLGVSQMCISRVLTRTLRLLRTRLRSSDEQGPGTRFRACRPGVEVEDSLAKGSVMDRVVLLTEPEDPSP
jgi:RNA polymerase sigma-B factor